MISVFIVENFRETDVRNVAPSSLDRICQECMNEEIFILNGTGNFMFHSKR